MAELEEEVLIEVEAAQSVYGDDCLVLDRYPPHLHLQIKPRTADVFSQQFVEAVIGIRASSQYPNEPPEISIIDSKGLDEQRQEHLITSIHAKACELSSSMMLVALCEEAVERLTSMNHPDGDCPLCLCPLVEADAGNDSLPFMKLMSCFHCFHCECIIRWWNWLQVHKESDHGGSSGPMAHPQQIKTQQRKVEESMGSCPVCRKVFHAKDIEHVLDLVGAYSQLNLEDTKGPEHENLLDMDSEKIRRQKFEAILKLQQENNGLIEPKKTEVLLPGMFLPRPITTLSEPTNCPDKEASNREQATKSGTSASVLSNRPSSSNHRSSGARRKHRGKVPRTQVNKQWIMKENVNAD